MVQVDGGSPRQGLRLTAVSANGEPFNVNYSAGTTQGEYRFELPVGSYVIHAQSDTREESLSGSGRVTVTGNEVAPLTLHLAPAASLPIEVTLDPALESQKALGDLSGVANVAQFGLSLRDLSGVGDSFGADIPARPRENRTFEFRVPAGRYRLSGNGGGLWYVKSATYGGVANLLISDLVIAAGSAGEPIHLVASNLRGTVRGQVALAGTASPAWVYFFPQQPALAAPNPQPTGSDGSFFASMPVGSYSVAAFAHRIQEDLKESETVERLNAGAKSIEITSGTNPALNLDLSQVKEVPR